MGGLALLVVSEVEIDLGSLPHLGIDLKLLLLLEPERGRDQIGRETAAERVVNPYGIDIVAARHGDAIFGSFQLILE